MIYNSNEITRVRAKIQENMEAALREFEEENSCQGMFGTPLITYHYARDPIFDTLYRMGLCDHPSKVYRPGNTIITYFVPYSDSVIESNRSGSTPSPEWSAAYGKGSVLTMRLNRAIRETLEWRGRLVSYLNTQLDWNEKKAREEWSHKTVAFISGMGRFSTAGSFVTAKGFAGKFSGMITDGLYFDEKPDGLPTAEAEKFVNTIIEDSYGKCLSAKCIKACPCGAISENGVDRFKCQQHCKTINKYIPSPDVCGKCYYY